MEQFQRLVLVETQERTCQDHPWIVRTLWHYPFFLVVTWNLMVAMLLCIGIFRFGYLIEILTQEWLEVLLVPPAYAAFCWVISLPINRKLTVAESQDAVLNWNPYQLYVHKIPRWIYVAGYFLLHPREFRTWLVSIFPDEESGE